MKRKKVLKALEKLSHDVDGGDDMPALENELTYEIATTLYEAISDGNTNGNTIREALDHARNELRGRINDAEETAWGAVKKVLQKEFANIEEIMS